MRNRIGDLGDTLEQTSSLLQVLRSYNQMLTDGMEALSESPSGDGIMNAEAAPRQTMKIARNVEEAIELPGCRERITLLFMGFGGHVASFLYVCATSGRASVLYDQP